MRMRTSASGGIRLRNSFISVKACQLTMERLESICSAFGLICGIKCFENEPSKDEGFASAQYAFVQYYSKVAAIQAQKELNGRWFIGFRAMKVNFANPKNKQAFKMILPLWKCYDLANFYLGFNGWSVNIVSLREVDQTEDSLQDQKSLQQLKIDNLNKPDEKPSKQIRCMQCRIRMAFPRYSDIYAIGDGLAEIVPNTNDPGNLSNIVNSRAKSTKLAYQRACKDAYSQLLFVILNNGKLYIEIFRQESHNHFCELPIAEDLFDNQVHVNVLKEELQDEPEPACD
ncbi:uncharacterized protein TRIADDRAFT_58188 [Trichoplax adhaerens]|uniref:RAD52 motif-containing protein 1 n=1 Tax=Trichoplax adhaerens TaxID=10228 RepID=B3S141_TRIAD|nr:hypothetical protein TRIADDRAFT_58188 [Trichoplax adhaerens]EDV23500.1 hypothetical protein TRIADDRAFT_58188 [Trichoplax adhaerens]|eukprot:XP_002114410.1 hypothetical protein TRIADDRAFT_58188 [Trichoplax adhaerens]